MKRPADPHDVAPWSLRARKIGWRGVFALGGGSVIAAFYIGTGDISIGSNMGAQFGYRLWWTYFVFAIAAWALVDMSVRYFLRFGRTPMTIFKDVHPVFSAYLLVTAVVCATFGSYNQWGACALVLSGLFPGLPIEVGGILSAAAALLFLITGAYRRIQSALVFGLILLLACFFGSALAAGIDWGAAARGLVPNIPGPGWQAPFAQNAGSMINAWLILIYPYTMIERGWYSKRLDVQVDILKRARIDYAWGMFASALVALPIMAAAAAVAGPFGIQPRGYMDLSILLEPLAGAWSTQLFLSGLYLAAWTAGIGWWLGGTYALLDVYNLPIKLDSRPARWSLALFAIPSALLIFLRIDPVFQMLIFSVFLTLIFPIIGVVLVYRVTRKDMGYYRWSLRSPQGVAVILVDLFAVGLSLYIGAWMAWSDLGKLFVTR